MLFRSLDKQESGSTVRLSGVFRYKPIAREVGRPLAETPSGDVFCTAIDRGQGRLIYWTIPRGMTIGKQAHPVFSHLLGHLSRDVMPIEVSGDVQWLVNRTEQGWAVTLINPAGQYKPQQGIVPTDFRENRSVTIRSRVPITSGRDLLLPTDALQVEEGTLRCEVPAGGVRIIHLRPLKPRTK